jgi:FkbM family methyltransferase
MIKAAELLSSIGVRIGKPPGWERIVRLFASPEKCRAMGDLCVVRDGSAFLARPAVPVEWHVTFFGTYEPELREIFRVVLSPGGIALDIGANVGWHTLLMARLVGEGGRVLAAEANPHVRARLQDNLNLNRLGGVEIIPYALGDSDGVLDFYAPDADDPDSGNGHVVAAGEKVEGNLVRVEIRRLDAIASVARIDRLDLIKIDAEGFEWPVLKGGEATIARFRPHIVFEYDTSSAGRGGGSPALIDDFFCRHRYRLYSVGRTWAQAIERGSWPKNANIWATPFGNPAAG